MKKVDKTEIKAKGGKILGEFKAFVLRGNVMDMAIGVIIGTAFATIVTALTTDFINPLINSIGGAEVSGRLKIWGGQYLEWGHFLTAVINFLIMAVVLFLMLKFVNGLMNIGKKKTEEKTIKEEPKKDEQTLLLEEIRDLLKKESKKNK